MADPMKIRAQMKGDAAEVRVLMSHPMETGQRKDSAQFKPRPERKEKPIDPNSPFASLLALKEKLEADKKGKG